MIDIVCFVSRKTLASTSVQSTSWKQHYKWIARYSAAVSCATSSFSYQQFYLEIPVSPALDVP